MSMSELVKRLVGKCGPGDTSLMCDYVTNITLWLEKLYKPL